MAKLKKITSGTRLADQGFTVVEFLIACALLSMMMAAMVKFFTMINYTYTTQNAAANVQQVVRTGIDIMTQNIRMAGLNPFHLEGVGIQDESTADSIRFSYDENADGTIVDVTYLHHDNQLKKRLGDGNRVGILDNVTDLTFTYLDGDNQDTTDINTVKTVEISMTVSVPAGRGRTVSRTYATRVLCRNLGL